MEGRREDVETSPFHFSSAVSRVSCENYYLSEEAIVRHSNTVASPAELALHYHWLHTIYFRCQQDAGNGAAIIQLVTKNRPERTLAEFLQGRQVTPPGSSIVGVSCYVSHGHYTTMYTRTNNEKAFHHTPTLHTTSTNSRHIINTRRHDVVQEVTWPNQHIMHGRVRQTV